MPVRQVAREVVRAEHRNHAVGLVAQHRRGIAQRAAFFTGALAVALYRDRHLVDHAGDFGGRLPQRLAGFFTDAAGQFIGVGFQARGEGFEHAQALFERPLGPGRKRLTRSFDRLAHLLGIGRMARPQHLLGDRVQRLDDFALTVLPGACDIQRAHYLDSREAAGWADNGTART